jgi:hypothetical protein
VSRAVVALLVAMLVVGATPPPTIYRVVSRPLCAELHEHIAPAIGMMMQNDLTIKKSPELFSRYNIASLEGPDAATASLSNHASGSSDSGSNASQNMALQGLENLIRPIANNIIAIQTTLDSPALLKGTGRQEDDAELQEIRDKLLKALAVQNASLDIISGFVDTQQMADLQHAGEAYIASMSQPDTTSTINTPGPLNPLEANPNYAGLPPNPYNVDLATVPGLTLGYNPVTRLLDALRWTLTTTEQRENDASKAILSAAALCSDVEASPTPSP